MSQPALVTASLAHIAFHQGDVITKLLKLRGWSQRQLAAQAEHGENTISRLINNSADTDDAVLEHVLRVLNVERADVEALVSRMNGAATEITMAEIKGWRGPFDRRADDRDPARAEVLMHCRSILAMPPIARMIVYNFIKGIETLLSPTESS